MLTSREIQEIAQRTASMIEKELDEVLVGQDRSCSKADVLTQPTALQQTFEVLLLQ